MLTARQRTWIARLADLPDSSMIEYGGRVYCFGVATSCSGCSLGIRRYSYRSKTMLK